MPHKLGFHIAHASSEDDNGRSRELLQQGPGVKGWASARFCVYPQEIVVQLTERCNLARVQILVHQHLIPEKIELYMGDVSPGKEISLHNARFAQLGYVTLSDNQQSGFKARELKSVSVECTGTFLKLILHKNHVNRLNLYNQIGVVAINVLGNEVETNNNSVSPDGEGGQVPSDRSAEVSPYHDLAFAMYVDTQVATTIRTLEERRATALRERRHEYANKLKGTVTQLRSAGERLGKYEIEKRHAIETENYERAKLKRQQAEEYRELVYKALQIDDLLERKGRLDKNDIPGGKGLPVLPSPPRIKTKPRSREPSPSPSAHTSTQLPPARPTNTPPKPPPSPPKSPSPPPIKTPSAPLPDLRPAPYQYQASTPRLPPASPRHKDPLPPPPAAPSPAPYSAPSSAYDNYDERTLPALKHRDVLERAVEEPDTGSSRRLTGLTDADKKDASLPLDVFGPDLVERFYSKNYTEKEAGLKMLQQEMGSYVPSAGIRPDRFVRATMVLVRRALRDKVYSVAHLAAQMLSLVLKEFFVRHKVSRKEMTLSLEKVLPDLLAKTSDNATRTQSLAVTAILEMLALSHDRGLGGVGVEVTRPLTNSVHPRGALCRANIVETQLSSLGPTALPRDKDSGFTPRQLVEFGHSAFKHQNNEVRKVGERLLLTLYAYYPGAVRRALPLQDEIARRNVLYRNLFEQIESIDEKRESGAGARSRPSQAHAANTHSSANTTPTTNASTIHGSTNTTPSHSSTPLSSSSSSVSTGSSSADQYPIVPQISITPDDSEVRGRALSRLNRSRTDLRMMEDVPSPTDPEDKTCIFCGAFDNSFNDTGLDLHYWRVCPMLTRCSHCRQVVEVASMTQHLLGECEASSLYRRCERCSEAIPKKHFQNHAMSKTCKACKPEPIANHCPLCHENIPPWDQGWKNHLMPGPNCCPANPRTSRSQASKKGASSESSSPGGVADSGGGGGGETHHGGGALSARSKTLQGSSSSTTPRKTPINRRR